MNESRKADGHYINGRWNSLFKNKNPTASFLFLINQQLEAIYIALGNQIQTLTSLSGVISRARLWSLLKKDFIKLFLPMITKCCLVELHYCRLDGLLKGDTSEERFRSFIRMLMNPAYAKEFMAEYPVLNELLARKFQFYQDAMTLFFERLNTDISELQNTYFCNNNIIKLKKLDAAGDSHRGGHRALILTFQCDNKITERLLYKPHSLSVDLAYYQFLDWVNIKLPELPLIKIKTLNKDGYGWCQYIENKPVSSEKELTHYYYNVGKLVAVLYLLGGQDIHAENIIACGKAPVIIDLECLISPCIDKLSIDHVGQSLLLPNRFHVTKDSRGVDLSGLNDEYGQKGIYKKSTWKKPLTDEMYLIKEEFYIPRSKNLPYITGKRIKPIRYFENEIENGFKDLYLILIKNKTSLLSKNSPLQTFRSLPIRCVMRSTSDYAKLLMESFHPELMVSWEKYKDYLSWLEKVVVYNKKHGSILQSEYISILRGDIPYFFAYANENRLRDQDHNVQNYQLAQSGYDRLIKKLKRLDRADLALQLRILSLSFRAQTMNKQVGRSARNSIRGIRELPKKNNRNTCGSTQALDTGKTESYGRYQSLARQILTYLHSVMFECGSYLGWPTLTYEQHQAVIPSIESIGLYSGLLGSALVFSYADYCFSDQKFRPVIIKILANVGAEISGKNFDPGLGFSGAGGMLYALHKLAKVGYKNEVQPMIKTIIERSALICASDEDYDIIYGNIGLLSSLTNTKFEFLGQRQLAQKIFQQFLKKWPDPHQFGLMPVNDSEANSPKHSRVILGYAHGITGCASTLHRFSPNNTQVKQWVHNTMMMLDDAYFETNDGGYWPDQRFDYNHLKYPPIPPHWCAGHVGIGLFYLDILNTQHSERAIKGVLRAKAQAIKTISNIYNYEIIGLCCGISGDLDFLIELNRQLPNLMGNTELFQYKQIVYNYIVNSSRLEELSNSLFYDLMHGHFGIAYVLLRCLEKDVPCILRW